MASSQSTLSTCASCGDSPLSITGNVTGVATFAYAVLLGTFFLIRQAFGDWLEASGMLRQAQGTFKAILSEFVPLLVKLQTTTEAERVWLERVPLINKIAPIVADLDELFTKLDELSAGLSLQGLMVRLHSPWRYARAKSIAQTVDAECTRIRQSIRDLELQYVIANLELLRREVSVVARTLDDHTSA
ncbi:hypothetical protein TI39_contig541g00007 [Zymoseptoria brevis]|uniref:Uncharacterized protein n=1 Tax=Zymoseptoria brevis TaxID=1047168 RepID=A0A0F4GJB5_9PEZI|nr:hypothetical protein TI39_contig541g00007 [Zymoseptoria brevis]